MNQLANDYGSRIDTPKCDVEILAIPTAIFKNEEPGMNSEILNILRYVYPGNNFTPIFKIFSKYNVNGKLEHPLFTYLKENCFSSNGIIGTDYSYLWTPLQNNDLSANFEKFIIDHKGFPFARYSSEVSPFQLRSHLEKLMAE